MCVISPLIMDENKDSIMKQLKSTLTVQQQHTLDNIKKERLGIHLRGYGLGLVLSSLVLYYKFSTKNRSLNAGAMACITAAVTFTVNYFYYILSPKSDWMVVHLNTQNSKRLALGVSTGNASGSIEEHVNILSGGSFIVGSTSATSPASNKLAPVKTDTTVIAIQTCPIV